ncbi:MAG: DEAD/DEAH box helicase family protein [Lachnospiraceae bacterium]
MLKSRRILKKIKIFLRPILTYADECHRSIYNVWSQVLTYFDAFIIGLTATPDKRTFGEYGYDEIGRNEFDRAINNLYDCRCLSITEGMVELNGKIKS